MSSVPPMSPVSFTAGRCVMVTATLSQRAQLASATTHGCVSVTVTPVSAIVSERARLTCVCARQGGQLWV